MQAALSHERRDINVYRDAASLCGDIVSGAAVPQCSMRIAAAPDGKLDCRILVLI